MVCQKIRTYTLIYALNQPATYGQKTIIKQS